MSTKTVNTKIVNTKIKVPAVVLTCLLWTIGSTTLLAAEKTEDRFDGLVRVENARVHSAYINPDADFGAFQRVAIVDAHVAFRSNWQRDQNRSRSRSNIRAGDIERIKTDVAYQFRDVFIERMEAAGYEVVNETGDDVLVLRPAIIDLDITAPDTRRAGRGRTYIASAGAATLYIELLDSISGDVIGRAADRQVARRGSTSVTWANRVTNRADARRMFGDWANHLIEFLDQAYGVKGKK